MRTALLLALVTSLTLSHRTGLAGEAEAKTYFQVGSRAFESGSFAAAAETFARAYDESPRPGLLFSLAQAHRMEHAARKAPERLRDAIRAYEAYLDKDPNGKRAFEAVDHLSRLRPLATLEAPRSSVAPAEVTPALPRRPRTMISTPTPGATLAIDGKSVPSPFIDDLAPGKHALVIEAPGFSPHRRELVVDEAKGAPPLDIALEELPARLAVLAPEGAAITLDGRFAGEAPLAPLFVASGRHAVGVTMNGHTPRTERVHLERAERRELSVELETTLQRKVSFAVLGLGGGLLLAGGALGAVAFVKESDARAIRDTAATAGGLPAESLARFDDLRASRDAFRLAAVLSAGAGLSLTAIGVVLRVVDRPSAPPIAFEEATPPSVPEAPSAVELAISPAVGPGLVGASVVGAF